jgi:hypothetical protein
VVVIDDGGPLGADFLADADGSGRQGEPNLLQDAVEPGLEQLRDSVRSHLMQPKTFFSRDQNLQKLKYLDVSIKSFAFLLSFIFRFLLVGARERFEEKLSRNDVRQRNFRI